MEKKKSPNMRAPSKLGPNSCPADDFAMSPVAGSRAGTDSQQPRHSRAPSNFSLHEGSACAQTHQYHYIQYPAYYHKSSAAPHCGCPCSCRPTQLNSGRHLHQQQPSSDDSQVAVAVTVHRQDAGEAGPPHQQVLKAKSEQSLLEHSYQALTAACDDDSQLQLAATGADCNCDLECSCSASVALSPKRKRSTGGGMSALMLGADEITVSESDNNSTTVKRKSRDANHGNGNKKINSWSTHADNLTAVSRGECERKTAHNGYSSSQMDIYSDGDGTDSCLKISHEGLSEDDQRPPLPPRPPPRPRNVIVNMNAHRSGAASGIKKYVVWCLVCGGFSCLLGVLFLGVYFLLHSYTITVGNFETVPTFVPAALLILTGLCIMSLARRRNRYSYLIKLSGACGLISALTCALVTVTTTVLHMSRLQALRECEYAQKTRTCTCYSDVIESQVERVDNDGVRLVFDSLSDCGVVHGSLYSCLRAIFGLSVAGVLVAVFSCMLVYQLLSHERKKMYWEQLELRCRSLYTSQQGPAAPSMAAIAGGRINICRCCEQCHAHRAQLPLQPAAYPWDDGGSEPRFWTGQPPGNFYSPNPGAHDVQHNPVFAADGACRSHGLLSSRSRVTGWSWPRMPWQRSDRLHATASSADSQYGFSNAAPQPGDGSGGDESAGAGLPFGVWGPPPPYSDPNSPARRGYYQFVHEPHAVCLSAHSAAPSVEQHSCRPPAHRSASGLEQQLSDAAYCPQATTVRSLSRQRQQSNAFRGAASKGDYENTPSDSDGGRGDRFSNTLPTRKMKKRVEAGAKSIGPNSQPAQRVNVQQLFSGARCSGDSSDHCADKEPADGAVNGEGGAAQNCINTRETQRHKIGVENSAFQRSAEGSSDGRNHAHCDPSESEVYFADVSSCCNVSVRNDNYYDDANKHQRSRLHAPSAQHNGDEDYLAHRFGQRENSVRSRLPFPQAFVDDYDGPPAAGNANGSGAGGLQKEISRQSMCSVESEATEKTEFTDLSPATPCSGNSFVAPPADPSPSHDDAGAPPATRMTTSTNTFVASFPYLAESQSLEAHRRSTKYLSNERADAQYDVISGDAATSCNALNFLMPSNATRSSKAAQLQLKEGEKKQYQGEQMEWAEGKSCPMNPRQHL